MNCIYRVCARRHLRSTPPALDATLSCAPLMCIPGAPGALVKCIVKWYSELYIPCVRSTPPAVACSRAGPPPTPRDAANVRMPSAVRQCSAPLPPTHAWPVHACALPSRALPCRPVPPQCMSPARLGPPAPISFEACRSAAARPSAHAPPPCTPGRPLSHPPTHTSPLHACARAQIGGRKAESKSPARLGRPPATPTVCVRPALPCPALPARAP